MTSLLTTHEETKSQTVSKHDTTRESVTEGQKVVVCVKGFRGKKIEFTARETKVAHAILAQKERGTSNLGEDIVICRKKK